MKDVSLHPLWKKSSILLSLRRGSWCGKKDLHASVEVDAAAVVGV